MVTPFDQQLHVISWKYLLVFLDDAAFNSALELLDG